MASASDPRLEQRSGLASPPGDDLRQRWEHLWRTYSKLVFLYAATLVRNHDEAEEIASLVFEKAGKWLQAHPAAEAAGMNYRPWLVAITRNAVRDRMRRQNRVRPWSDIEASSPSAPLDPPDLEACQPGDALLLAEEMAALTKCLGSLPDEARQMIELRYVARLKCRDVAERLSIQPSAAAQRLHRLTKQLRACVEAALP